MKYTRTNLKKLEELCHAIGYKVRYEQGHFQSGHCRVESKKVLVINKFYDIEGRMNCLFELLPELPLEAENLPDEVLSNYHKMLEFSPVNEPVED